MNMQNSVTGLVICRNEERNIADCLKSIEWCDQIVVVDAFSTDRTVEYAEKFTHNIHLKEWQGFKKQREFALSKISGGWIFSLDADERCSPELAVEAKQSAGTADSSVNGFLIPRKNLFLGKWVRHGGWYPGYQMRLFRADKACVTDRLVHESFDVEGNVLKLKSNIIHYAVASVDEYTDKISRYASLSAEEKKSQSSGFYRLFVYPRLEFAKQYFLKGGFLDGKEGLMAANFHMMTKILTYMKIAEKKLR